MRKFWQKLKSFLAVVLTLAIVFGAGFLVGKNSGKDAEVVQSDAEGSDLKLPGEVEKRVVTVDEVEVALVGNEEFSTYSGEYTAVKSVDYTRYFLDDIPIPGTTNTIYLECKGIVKVGYDVEDISVSVDNDSQKIYISLPASEVLDNYGIWDTVECRDENNILNPINFVQYQTLIAEIEEDGLASVEAEGIYESAEENMMYIICGLLAGFEDYEIVFL